MSGAAAHGVVPSCMQPRQPADSISLPQEASYMKSRILTNAHADIIARYPQSSTWHRLLIVTDAKWR
jgi:hypothetical protein